MTDAFDEKNNEQNHDEDTTGTQGEEQHEDVDIAKDVFEGSGNHPIDLGWVGQLDCGAVELLERIANYEMSTSALDAGMFATREDVQAYGEGIARVAAKMFNICRNKDEVELVTLLIAMARGGYEAGVRDAGEGRLSKECVRLIAERVAKSDERYDAMKEFYDELNIL